MPSCEGRSAPSYFHHHSDPHRRLCVRPIPDDYWCECAEYNDYGCASCPDGCNIHEFVERYIDHQNSEGPLVVKLDPKGEYAAEYYVAVGGYYGTSKNCYGGTMCYNPASCCDWRDKAASALETVTAPIIPAYGKKEEYIKYSGECFWSQPREASGTKTFSCTNSQNLCCDFSYSLSVIDYYSLMKIFRKHLGKRIMRSSKVF